MITRLTIKILFTNNSLKKSIPSTQYLQFLSFKKNTSFWLEKIHLIKKIIQTKNILFHLKQSISIKKNMFFKVDCILKKKITEKDENLIAFSIRYWRIFPT